MGRSETPKRPVAVVFGDGVPELLQELPEKVRHQAGQLIELLSLNPYMYEVRRRGLMVAVDPFRSTDIASTIRFRAPKCASTPLFQRLCVGPENQRTLYPATTRTQSNPSASVGRVSFAAIASITNSGTFRPRPAFRTLQTSKGASKKSASIPQPYSRAIRTYCRRSFTVRFVAST